MGYIVESNNEIIEFSAKDFFDAVHGDQDIVQMKMEELNDLYNEFKELYSKYEQNYNDKNHMLENTDEQIQFMLEDVGNYLAEKNIDAASEFIKEKEFLNRERIDTLSSMEDIRIKLNDIKIIMDKLQSDLLYLFVSSLKN